MGTAQVSDATLAHWRTWVGRSEQRHDVLGAAALRGLAATLDRDDPDVRPGDEAPPLAHWMCFAPTAQQSQLGPDGHAARGGFLPPIELPRRMWAGGRLQFHHALRAGDAITRHSRVARVDAKSGRSGLLAFVTVEHEVHGPRGLAISEEHDIVYRDAPQPGAKVAPALPADTDETFARAITPDPVLLFRYSALTFNGHRIHYDRTYVTEVEGYAGLIVHGPLIATLLMDLLRRHRADATVRRFDFTAVRPLFDLHPFTLCGRADDGDARRFRLWTRDHEGKLTMRASAEIA
jgi:3-methylfumaryl-CoA hydratase